MLISTLSNFPPSLAGCFCSSLQSNEEEDSLAGKMLAPPVALAMGIFDGIHKGHAEILSRAAQEAQKTGGIFGVLTFDPHPSVLFSGAGVELPPLDKGRAGARIRIAPRTQSSASNTGASAAKLIIPLEVRLQRLAELGAAFAICEPFTKEFASTTAEDFIDLLKCTIPTLASIHVGENFRFGAKRGGDVEVLRSLGKKLGIAVDVAPAVEWNGRDYEVNNGVRQTISSTRIREAIGRGDVGDANAMLSKPYQIEGKIIGGKKLGRQLGFPTLNLPWTYELAPRFGVYTVRAYWTSNGKQLSAPAVANFGIRPSVEQTETPLLETFLLDPPPEIPTTGDTLRVEFVRFLRPEQHFPSLDALRSQLAKDSETARQLFNSSSSIPSVSDTQPSTCSQTSLAPPLS